MHGRTAAMGLKWMHCCNCCMFAGLAPYQVEVDTEYRGHELAVLNHLDSAARSPAHCASACTGHQGRVRCSAWTFIRNPSSSAGRCILRSSKGSEAVNSSSVVSGYIQGVCMPLTWMIMPLEHLKAATRFLHGRTMTSRPAGCCFRCHSATQHVSIPALGESCNIASNHHHADPLDAACCLLTLCCILAGTHPYILQQGAADVFSDLPDGVVQQPALDHCAAACRDYKGPAACIAWSYSSPTNSTNGTCWLKATPGATPQVARSMVSAVMPGE